MMSTDAETQIAANGRPVKTSPFEFVPCHRCDGTGYTGFHWVQGGVCFRCGGTGFGLTARGRAAQEFFVSLLSRPANTIKVGDVIRVPHYNAFITVTEIGELRVSAWLIGADSTRTPCPATFPVTGETKDGRSYGTSFAPEEPVRFAATVDEKRAAMAKALELQASLTKTGKPRKR